MHLCKRGNARPYNVWITEAHSPHTLRLNGAESRSSEMSTRRSLFSLVIVAKLAGSATLDFLAVAEGLSITQCSSFSMMCHRVSPNCHPGSCKYKIREVRIAFSEKNSPLRFTSPFHLYISLTC
jgi:hypothetical protein